MENWRWSVQWEVVIIMHPKHYQLKTLFHMAGTNPEEVVDTEYARRISTAASISWDFEVSGYRLFCFFPSTLTAKIERVLQRELSVSRLWSSLTGAAQSHYLFSLLIAEVIATNEIEGIHSTRREIHEALRQTTGQERKRFHEFSRLYLQLATEQSVAFPQNPVELRKLYDSLLHDEVSPDDAPDGELFRANAVHIIEGAREVHRGLEPEAAINKGLQTALEAVNNREDNRLVNVLASHFMFEYVHPFYDGNGRLGRFLLSTALSNVVSLPTALTLSSQLATDKSKYYKAFSITEEPMNRGELTFFVDIFLDVLLDAQEYLLEELSMKQSQLNKLSERIDELGKTGGDSEYSRTDIQTLFVLGQVQLFGPEYGISLADLAKALQRTTKTARSYVSVLEERGLVSETSKRPLMFTLSASGCKLLEAS